MYGGKIGYFGGKRRGYKLINENSEIMVPVATVQGSIDLRALRSSVRKNKAPLSQLDPNVVPTHRTLDL